MQFLVSQPSLWSSLHVPDTHTPGPRVALRRSSVWLSTMLHLPHPPLAGLFVLFQEKNALHGCIRQYTQDHSKAFVCSTAQTHHGLTVMDLPPTVHGRDQLLAPHRHSPAQTVPNLKPTGSPTKSAKERARARRRHIPWDEYDPNDGRTVRGRATSSLLSGRGEGSSRRRLETRRSRTFGVDRSGSDDDGVLRLVEAQRRGGSVGEGRWWVPGQTFRREFRLPGDTESEEEREWAARDGDGAEEEEDESEFPQRHVRFDDGRHGSSVSPRPRFRGPPYVGIFGDEIEEYEYDGEEFEEEDVLYSPNDFVYDRRRPVSSGLPRRSVGSLCPSTGAWNVPYSPSGRRSTLGAGRSSPTRPPSAMPGTWPSSSRSSSAQAPAEPSRRIPGQWLSSLSSLSAPGSPPPPPRTLLPRTRRQATLRSPTRGYSPTGAPWRPGTGRDASPYSPHTPSSSPPVPSFPYVSRYGDIRGNDSKTQQPRRAAHSPRLVQRSRNHWSISEGGSPTQSSSSSGLPSRHAAQQPLRKRTPRPYTSPRSRASPRQNSLIVRPNTATWSERRNAELEALRAENQGLRVHNEELQQMLREVLQYLDDIDESEDKDAEAMASGALQEESDIDVELAGNFEFGCPTPSPSVYESAQAQISASSKGRSSSAGNGSQDSKRSSQAMVRSSAQQAPPLPSSAPAVQTVTGPSRPSNRISKRNAKRVREAEDAADDDVNDVPAKKRGRSSGKGKGMGRK